MNESERDDAFIDVEPPRLTIRRRGRRVTTGDPERGGAAPDPEPEHAESENDERLRGDRPPHWG